MIAKSRQRRNGGLAAAGMVAIIAVSLTTLYHSDRGQIWLMERDLRLLAQKTRDPALLKKSALAFFASNHVQKAWEVVERIRDPQDKAETLQALAEAAAKAESWRLAREMADMIPSVDGRIQTFSQILMIWADKEALPAAKKKAAS